MKLTSLIAFQLSLANGNAVTVARRLIFTPRVRRQKGALYSGIEFDKTVKQVIDVAAINVLSNRYDKGQSDLCDDREHCSPR